MKREIIGLFCSFAIVVALLMGVALYAYTNTDVRVSTTEQLLEAITNAKEDEKIVLTGDIELNEELEITSNVTLDLNGKTIKAQDSATSGSGPLISVNEGATLNLSGNGIIENTNQAPAINIAGGDVEISGGTIVGNAVYVEQGSATITGGTFKSTVQARSANYPLFASEVNLENGTASIVVKGGSFEIYDPAGSHFDNPIYNFMAEGFQSVYNEETGYYNVEEIGNTLYASSEHVLRKAINIAPENATIVLQKDFQLTRQITLTKSLTLDLNGKSLFTTSDICNNAIKEWSLISVQGGAEVVIAGEGFIIASDGETDECYGVDVRENSKLTIENATVVGNCSAVYVLLGQATINGGNYSINENSYVFEYRYTLNCLDANLKNGTADISVTGGTFKNFDPGASRSENPIYNFVNEGYQSKLDETSNSYQVEQIVSTLYVFSYQSLLNAIEQAEDGWEIVVQKNIELPRQITLTKSLTLNLNGKSLFTTKDICNNAIKEWSLISVQGGAEVVIAGNGSIIASNGETAECYGVDVRENSKLTIENATVVGNCSAVYVLLGQATINGGNYSINENSYVFEYRYTLNCLDANLKNGTADISVTGGTFKNFDPGASRSENPIYDFVADGYVSIPQDGVYTVSKLAA